MKEKLDILNLCQTERDVLLINEVLKKEGICFDEQVTNSKKNFVKALKDISADIILAEQLSSFSALEVLEILKDKGLKTPLILIYDDMPTEQVVEVIKSGASDCISKKRLEHLPKAVRLAMKQQQLEKERQEYIDKLERTATRLQTLIEHTVDTVVILNTEGKTTYASPSIHQVLGYTEKESLNLSLHTTIHPEDLPYVTKKIAESLKKPGISITGIECRYRHKNGNWLWYESTMTNMLHDPAINGIVNNFHDITDKKTGELELKDSEEKYKFLFQYSPSPKWIFDLETLEILDVNETAVKTYGYSREEFLSMITNDLKPPEELERMRKIHQNLKDNEGLIQFGIFTQVKKDGTRIKVEVSGHKCHFKNRRCMVIDSFDVTERENTLKELKDSREKLMTAQKIARIGYWKLNLEDFQIYWSDEIYNIGGLEKGIYEPTFDDLLGLIHPDDRENYYKNREETYNKVLDHEAEYRIVLKHAGGAVKWIHEKGKFIKDENGKPVVFEGTVQDITEQKLLELSLEESKLRYEMVSKATSDAIWDWDFITKKAYWGEGFQTIFGYDTMEIEQQENFWESNLHPADRKRVTKNVEKAIKSSQSNWSMEYRFRKADNTYAYVLDKGFFIRDKEGKAIRLAGGMQDITERKELEDLLEKATKLARIGSYEYNIENNHSIYWSHITKEIYEVPSDFVPIAEKIKDFHKAEPGLEIITKAFEIAIEKAIPFDVEIPILTGKGNHRWIRVIGETEFVNGKCTRVYGSVQDIDQRRKAEEALRISNKRYAIAAKATNDSIWDWDLENNRVERPDKTLENLLGYQNISPFEVNNFWQNHIHADDWKRITEKMNRLFENPNKNYWEDEYRFLKPDGSYATVYDRGYVIRDKNGKAIRMIGASRDISKLKESEMQLKLLNEQLEARAKELIASNQELEQFAYVASHDLQEPLRMVTNFLTQIEKKYNDILDEKGKTYIHFAVDGAKRMRQMILDLLEFSRAGRNIDVPEKVDLNMLVNEIIHLHQNQVEETNAIFRVSELPVIEIAKTDMRQVLQNLISNSLKYNQLKNGVSPIISISAKEDGNFWQFEVKDNGIGIEKEYFEKVFVIFQRLHDRSEYSGTGIGLAITRKIIENLQGKIWIESEIGKGTSFFFTIPKIESN